jgi:chorismate mutase
MFVSESKFRESPADFIPHILNPNREALANLITKPAVEAALLKRLEKKALMYGQDIGSDGSVVKVDRDSLKIDVDEVVRLYRDHIIPLTKEVEASCIHPLPPFLYRARAEKLWDPYRSTTCCSG